VNLAKERAEWLTKYLAATFQIRKKDGGGAFGVSLSEVPSAKASYSGLNTEERDADLVIIVAMHPKENKAIAAYAKCLVKHSMDSPGSIPTPGGCKIGLFNWCPSRLLPDTAHTAAQEGADLHTALHETLHVMGCCNAKYLEFYQATGAGTLTKTIATDVLSSAQAVPGTDANTRQVVFHKSPKVLATAREQFGCTTLPGVPMEDTPVGVAAHWEARVMGPEVMAYGDKVPCAHVGGFRRRARENPALIPLIPLHYIVCVCVRACNKLTPTKRPVHHAPTRPAGSTSRISHWPTLRTLAITSPTMPTPVALPLSQQRRRRTQTRG